MGSLCTESVRQHLAFHARRCEENTVFTCAEIRAWGAQDTGDTRETPAIDVCKGLTADNAKLVIYDPKVTEAQIHQDLATPKFEWDHPQSSGTKSPRSFAITVVGDAYTARTLTQNKNPKTQGVFAVWQRDDLHTLRLLGLEPAACHRPFACEAGGWQPVEGCLACAQACDGAHGITILTEWDEFKKLDYERIYKSMMKPAFVFDGRNILDHAKLREIGYIVYALGKPLDPFLKRG